MSVRPSRPSRLWYWVAGAAVAGSVVWLVLGFVFWLRSASEQVENFQRVPIPGRAEVNFDEAGGYTVYFEGLGADDETATLPAFRVSITPVGGGADVPVRPYGGSELYNMAELSDERSGLSRSKSRGGSWCRRPGSRRPSRPMSPLAGALLGRCS
jgi:hypothetical protein